MGRAAILLIALALSGLSAAMVVGPAIYEQDDFGDPALAQFTYSLSADCTASTISMIIMNGSNKPVKDANTYLKYVDFSSPLLSSVVTDKDGFALHKLPGNVQLMRGLFILVIEKKGFRNKEVHFDLYPCFHNGTLPPALQPKPRNTTNQTAPPPTIIIETPPPPPDNATGPAEEPEQNATEGGQPDGGGSPLCAPAAGAALLLFWSGRRRMDPQGAL
jgi:hypothetical protein